MIGAIIGDIIGSRMEFDPINDENFELFTDECMYTDDTAMTLAVSDWIMEGSLDKEILIDKMHYFGCEDLSRGYGGRFIEWLIYHDREPYNSFGNGSAMRVSPCAFFAKSLEEARMLAIKSAEVTHNHIEGIKGAEAIASAIYLAKEKKSKEEIKEYIEKEFQYDLSRKYEDVKKTYHFDETCQGSVPEALISFLESKDFEDAIRKAVLLKGDSDTQAAMVGGICEYYYGIPDGFKEKAMSYLTDELKEIVNRMYK